MAANNIAITTFLLVAAFADAGKRSWDVHYEYEGRSERSTLSLVQVALTNEEQSRRTASENEQHQDAASKHASEQAASDTIAVAEEAAMSVSHAASFVADISEETASKALSNASTSLEDSSVPVAKAAEDEMSEAFVRFFDASDQKASHMAEHPRSNSTQIRRHGQHQADRHSGTGAVNILAMHLEGGSPSAHHPWFSLLWSALHCVDEVMLRGTFALRAAIFINIACLVAVKVVHHHHYAHYMANPATLKNYWPNTPKDQQQDDLTAQTLAAGRDFYSRELQPDCPDLHEPSAFHEDKDSRRVVMGGD